jgi:LCP family protein required for cell wall assembly
MGTPRPTPDARQEIPGRRPPRGAPAGRRRGARLALGALILLAGALALDAAALAGRITRVPVQMPDGPGETWVLVGEDSRAHLPDGAPTSAFGSTDAVPGSRADVVLVVHSAGDRTTVLSVPRDVAVTRARTPGRLALSWLDGPQSTVDALCGLGIAADHLVAVDLAGFTAVVDALGGLDVDIPAPVRDPAAGLQLATAGPWHVDGATALALVRSRNPQQLVDGRWVPAPVDPDGRATAAAGVLSALADAAEGSLTRPWRLQALAWAASGELTVDSETSSRELLGVLHTELGRMTVLPVGPPVAGTLVRFPTDATGRAVVAAGMSCEP